MPPVNRNKPVRAKSSESEYTLMEFQRDFPDDATCLIWLWKARYSPNGTDAHCPKCDALRPFTRYETKQQRQSWTCSACGYHLHPTAGTIFHKSSTSLHLWFYAMYLMTSTRCGISAKQLERELGVTYKTAWRMAYLIRNKLMTQGGGPFWGDNPVEFDETYIGGKQRHAGRGRPGKMENKTPVLGIVQRKGRVYAVPVRNGSQAEIFPHIEERILPATTVFADEAPKYDVLHGKYAMQRIPHAERVYVSGNVHTNTIEGFWSLTKRGIAGVYHSVSRKHLQGYLNEYVWRYNQRHESKGRFEALILRASWPL